MAVQNPAKVLLSEQSDFPRLLSAVQRIAREVAAIHAGDVDTKARFPIETLTALKNEKVLSAPVPTELGGAGCNMRQLAALCSTLAQACGSSAMVLAMHFIQVACLARHGLQSAALTSYLRDLVKHQYILASMTSEVGTFGETRASICAVERDGDRFTLNKDATTGSYCQHADGILVTARRDTDAAQSDQVLVLVRKGDYKITQTTSWDTLGMRGTCSPGFKLESSGPEAHIIPGSFADSSAQTMVPYSHILWASLWWGIAANAIARASEFVRASARKKPGTVPPTATRLAEVSTQLQAMRHNWLALAIEFDEMATDEAGMQELLTIGWALKMNNLKINASETAPQIVHQALQIVGILGYKNDSDFSLGRHYRDVLSAALMISNDRIASKSASMLLVLKDH
jgi:acyl-CoA dehydrogenase